MIRPQITRAGGVAAEYDIPQKLISNPRTIVVTAHCFGAVSQVGCGRCVIGCERDTVQFDWQSKMTYVVVSFSVRSKAVLPNTLKMMECTAYCGKRCPTHGCWKIIGPGVWIMVLQLVIFSVLFGRRQCFHNGLEPASHVWVAWNNAKTYQPEHVSRSELVKSYSVTMVIHVHTREYIHADTWRGVDPVFALSLPCDSY